MSGGLVHATEVTGKMKQQQKNRLLTAYTSVPNTFEDARHNYCPEAREYDQEMPQAQTADQKKRHGESQHNSS